jgi:hypothetical protein
VPWLSRPLLAPECPRRGVLDPDGLLDALEPHPRLANRAQKIAQLTGEFDREGWNGTGTPRYALSQTKSRFNIVGTDLGASFSHQGRLYFLFGDTWRVGHNTSNDDLDAIAFVQMRMPAMALN